MLNIFRFTKFKIKFARSSITWCFLSVFLIACVPVEDKVSFTVHNLKIRSNSSSNDQLNVALFLDVQPSQSIYFISDQFSIKDIQRNSSYPMKSIFVSRVDGIKSPSIPFPQKGAKLSPLGYNFSVYATFENKDLEIFEFISPPININGIEYEFPRIRFEKKIWVGISPFNC